VSFFRDGEISSDVSTLNVHPVGSVFGFDCIFNTLKIYETKTLGLPGLSIDYQIDTVKMTVLLKNVLYIRFACAWMKSKDP